MRHLAPPVTYTISQGRRTLPDVGFPISNLGDTYPIRVNAHYLHSALGYQSPSQFECAYHLSHGTPFVAA
jgi:hypothetical protein